MARRGRCQCGHILQFQHGPDGFKVRCPHCGSVVRLRSRGRRKKATSPSAPRLPAYGSETPLVIDSLETFPALSAATPETTAETNATPAPILVVELVPLVQAPATFWTRRQLLLLFVAGLIALVIGALICWFVWMATRAS
jgi:hypothetical protein